MDHEVAYDFEDEDQFWTGKAATILRSGALIRTLAVLDKTVSKECDNHSTIDDTLRSYLSLVGCYRGRALTAVSRAGEHIAHVEGLR
jgi:hypothetical protein